MGISPKRWKNKKQKSEQERKLFSTCNGPLSKNFNSCVIAPIAKDTRKETIIANY
jgi:hypothetical protein